MLHVIKGESIACVDVSKKFRISFLVARGGREEEAHQDDEGKDVAHRHVVHVAKLRYTGVDPSDVLRAGFRGVVGQGVWYKEGGIPTAGKDVEPASQGPERGDRWV